MKISPGDQLLNTACPCCGAQLEVIGGEDEGEIGVIGTSQANPEDVARYDPNDVMTLLSPPTRSVLEAVPPEVREEICSIVWHFADTIAEIGRSIPYLRIDVGLSTTDESGPWTYTISMSGELIEHGAADRIEGALDAAQKAHARHDADIRRLLAQCR